MKPAKPSDHKGTAKYTGQKPKLTRKPEDQDDRRKKTSDATVARRKLPKKG